MFRKNERHLQQSFISGLNELPEKLKERLENSWSGAFYEQVFAHIDEEVYAVLYSDEPSRPNVPVNVLVGLEMLKAGQGWSDEEMYDNVCYNVQVRHALGLRNLDEGYFGMRTIYVFRDRLVKHMAQTGQNLFEQTFIQVTQEQLAKYSLRTNHQRIDSTQIASNIRQMSRLQLLVEVLQRVHRMLNEADQAHWGSDFEPYLKGTSGQYTWRLKGKEAHQPHLAAIGQLMSRLVVELADPYQEHETYQVLVRVFKEHFNQSDDDDIAPKDNSDLKASNLQSPDDLTASYRYKRGQSYIGYVANITETAHPDNDFQLILNGQVEPNTTDDATMLADIVPQLKAKYGLDLMDADGGYGSPAVDEVLATHNVVLRQSALRGRQPQDGAFNLADCQLTLDPDDRTLLSVTTPDGTDLIVEPGRKDHRYILRSPPSVTDLPAALYISKQDVEVALRRQRSALPIPDGKNPRAAIESTIGAIKRPFDNDKLPVRGLFRVGFMVIASAAMVNLRRIHRFQAKKRKNAQQLLTETGSGSTLFPFLSRFLAFFLPPFFSLARFSARYP